MRAGAEHWAGRRQGRRTCGGAGAAGAVCVWAVRICVVMGGLTGRWGVRLVALNVSNYGDRWISNAAGSGTCSGRGMLLALPVAGRV